MCDFIEDNKKYLTSSIFIYNKKMYYEEDENNIIKITLKNCFKYLGEYGWIKIDKGWSVRLGNKKFCRYGVLECGGEGDCLFHCVSEALNSTFVSDGNIYTSGDIRSLAAEQITDDNLSIILENYKIQSDINEFDGYWDPFSIKNVEEMRMELRKCGDNFWGDHIIIQLLQKALKMNIVILNSEKTDYFGDTISELTNDERYTFHPLAHNLEDYDKTMFLYYISELHFLLLGYFNGKHMQTIFNTHKIPNELYEVYKRDCKMI